MKILQLVTKRQFRGAEIFAANLSLELIKFGHEIIFAGLYKNDNEILLVKKARNIDLLERKATIFSTLLVAKIAKLIKEERPDIIQCNGSDTLKYMVATTYFLSVTPPIVYRNISMISKWMIGSPKKIIYQKIFSKISHVSSVGNEAKEDFLKTFKYPAENVSVIRRGIPAHKVHRKLAREKVLKDFKLNSTDKIVIHMGHFSPEKNHIFLLDF